MNIRICRDEYTDLLMSERYGRCVRQVSVVVIEPWSHVTQDGSHSTADVVATDGTLMLLEMNGQFYVATPRGDNDEPTFSLIPTTTKHSQRGAPWVATSGADRRTRCLQRSARSNVRICRDECV